MSRNHATRPMRTPDGRTVEIDAGMVEVVGALWALGIETAQCCEEWEPGIAWLAFADARTLSRSFAQPGSTSIVRSSATTWLIARSIPRLRARTQRRLCPASGVGPVCRARASTRSPSQSSFRART